MTTILTPAIQDQLNFSALILRRNHPDASVYGWFGFDHGNELDVKCAKRIAKLHGIHSSMHLRNGLIRYSNGEMVSQSFENLAASFRMDTTATFDAKYLALTTPKLQRAYKLVWKYRFSLKTQMLIGYELAYYVFLLRLGGFLGYISVDEIAFRLEDVNERIKNTFSSWSEFHRNVCIGEEYFTGNAKRDSSAFPGAETLWDCYQRLEVHYGNCFKEWK